MKNGKTKWDYDYGRVQKFLAGNQKMGEELYQELDNLLVGYLKKQLSTYSIGNEEIYDIKQDIIAKTIVDIEKYQGVSKFST